MRHEEDLVPLALLERFFVEFREPPVLPRDQLSEFEILKKKR